MALHPLIFYRRRCGQQGGQVPSLVPASLMIWTQPPAELLKAALHASWVTQHLTQQQAAEEPAQAMSPLHVCVWVAMAEPSVPAELPG